MNLNPLVPLDGYFALSDWLEVPNLRHRAMAHIDWTLQPRVLRQEMPMPPATSGSSGSSSSMASWPRCTSPRLC